MFGKPTLLETVGETNCCLDLFPVSLPHLEAVDKPCLDAKADTFVYDMGRSHFSVGTNVEMSAYKLENDKKTPDLVRKSQREVTPLFKIISGSTCRDVIRMQEK